MSAFLSIQMFHIIDFTSESQKEIKGSLTFFSPVLPKVQKQHRGTMDFKELPKVSPDIGCHRSMQKKMVHRLNICVTHHTSGCLQNIASA